MAVTAQRLEEQTARIIQVTGGWGLYDPLHGSDARAQCLKMAAEFGELSGHMFPFNQSKLADDIGDVYVTMITTSLLSNGNAQQVIDAVLAASKHYDEDEDKHIFAAKAPFAVSQYIGMVADQVLKGRDPMERITDAARWLVGFAMAINLDFGDCVQEAIDEISKRNGKMVNGVFIKEGDEA